MTCVVHPSINKAIVRLDELMGNISGNEKEYIQLLEQAESCQRKTQVLCKEQPKFKPSLRKYRVFMHEINRGG